MTVVASSQVTAVSIVPALLQRVGRDPLPAASKQRSLTMKEHEAKGGGNGGRRER